MVPAFRGSMGSRFEVRGSTVQDSDLEPEAHEPRNPSNLEPVEPRTRVGLVSFRSLVDGRSTAADRCTNQGALLAAHQAPDAGTACRAAADHHRRLLPRPAASALNLSRLAVDDLAHGARPNRFGPVNGTRGDVGLAV